MVTRPRAPDRVTLSVSLGFPLTGHEQAGRRIRRPDHLRFCLVQPEGPTVPPLPGNVAHPRGGGCRAQSRSSLDRLPNVGRNPSNGAR